MNFKNQFEKQLKLIAKFNGVCLNLDEKTKWEIGLVEWLQKTENETWLFWGKILGEESDYYIAEGIQFKGNYGFPQKKFYFATNKFEFELLPETYPYHDKDMNDSYYKPLKGTPLLIIKKYKEDVPEGENPEGEVKQEEVKEPEPGEADQSKQGMKTLEFLLNDEPPKKPEPKENFTEKLKLSYLVRQIDYDTSIIPEGVYKLNTEHEIEFNRSFKGLPESEIGEIKRWMHFRKQSEKKEKMLEEDNAIYKKNIFDSIIDDEVRGSWSLQLDSTKTSCNVRSLLWPGYFAAHQSNSKLYTGVYFGNAMKDCELAFTI